MNLTEMKNILRTEINQSRYKHSINVMNTAVKLAKKWGCDEEKVSIAALLHDCARDVKKEEAIELCRRLDIKTDDISNLDTVLLHGKIGSKFAGSKYNVKDEEIISAIACHTTGKVGMSIIEKIIFLSDYIEPERKFRGVGKARKLSKINLDEAVLYCLDNTIRRLISTKRKIHCDTLDARNFEIDLLNSLKTKQFNI